MTGCASLFLVNDWYWSVMPRSFGLPSLGDNQVAVMPSVKHDVALAVEFRAEETLGSQVERRVLDYPCSTRARDERQARLPLSYASRERERPGRLRVLSGATWRCRAAGRARQGFRDACARRRTCSRGACRLRADAVEAVSIIAMGPKLHSCAIQAGHTPLVAAVQTTPTGSTVSPLLPSFRARCAPGRAASIRRAAVKRQRVLDDLLPRRAVRPRGAPGRGPGLVNRAERRERAARGPVGLLLTHETGHDVRTGGRVRL